MDVVLFNREQILVLQTSAVGMPLPSIKWYGKLSGNSTTGWNTLESTMFDKRNDSIASFAKIEFFEGMIVFRLALFNFLFRNVEYTMRGGKCGRVKP